VDLCDKNLLVILKRLVAIFILILLFLIKADIYSQSYYFKHYQVENGLSNNTVLCSIQDNRGFMWFGTKDGINRFDGYSFKVFRNDVDDKNTIGENYVRGLYKDDSGYIYAGTSKGIYKYDEVKENFNTVIKTNSVVREMIRDTAGNFWFIDGITLKCIDNKTKSIRIYAGEKYGDINTICRAVDGTLWFATTGRYIEKI
jgi:ligand-binding sensor domain-containing protein